MTYLDVPMLAERLGVPVATVYQWRYRGTGPRAHKFGRHLRFSLSDVERWETEHADPDADA